MSIFHKPSDGNQHFTQLHGKLDDNQWHPARNLYEKKDDGWHPTYNYDWVPEPWQDCSAPCDGGYQIRSVPCKDQDGRTVNDGFCYEEPKPATGQECNTQDCLIEYKFHTYRPCRYNNIYCMKNPTTLNVWNANGNVFALREQTHCIATGYDLLPSTVIMTFTGLPGDTYYFFVGGGSSGHNTGGQERSFSMGAYLRMPHLDGVTYTNIDPVWHGWRYDLRYGHYGYNSVRVDAGLGGWTTYTQPIININGDTFNLNPRWDGTCTRYGGSWTTSPNAYLVRNRAMLFSIVLPDPADYP